MRSLMIAAWMVLGIAVGSCGGRGAVGGFFTDTGHNSFVPATGGTGAQGAVPGASAPQLL